MKRMASPGSEPLSPRWSSASISDVGNVRAHNEDACVEVPNAGVWLVADGMGGHEAGDYASRKIADSVAEITPSRHLGLLVAALRRRLRRVNRELRAEGDRRGGGIVGSTVAALVLHGRHAVCVWAGDSRVYRLRDGELLRLTIDHRWVEELVASGLMTREQADHHPQSNEITRALGAEETIDLDFNMREAHPRDIYLLCSDGLYGEVAENEISRCLSEFAPAEACARLLERAKSNGARDNVTAVVVAIVGQPDR
jgi:serine/threonine protein phosphatase PrpC